MTIGERIRNTRKAKHLTQKQLGELTGIAEPTIRRYELGKLNPKYETIVKIAEALNVTPEFLMGKEDLIDLYMKGAKKWSTDFRFTDDQKHRIREFLAGSTSKLKEIINAMADAEQADGKILMNPHLQRTLDDISNWTANALKYVNNDYSDDPKV